MRKLREVLRLRFELKLGYVAWALAQKACRDGYSALYTRAVALFRDLAIARADASLRAVLARLSRIDVLVSTTGPWLRWPKPNAVTSGKSARTAIKPALRS
jgi:hypothetical protein